jgi:thioredoxin 1
MTPAVLRIVAFVAGGVVVGYLASLVLCRTGSCPITSNRGIMMVLGGLLGLYSAGAARGPASAHISSLEALTRTEQFDEALAQADTPVLVDFSATWCPPCRALAPVLEKMQGQWRGRVRFYTVDVDASPQIAQRFGVDGFPTVVLFTKGQEAERVTGNLPDLIRDALAKVATPLATGPATSANASDI